MTSRSLRMLCVLVGVFATPALAHHSFAMFDASITTELQGVVKEFQWTNPHSWIQVMVSDAQGKEVEWGFELGGPTGLTRGGWTPKTIVPGDKVSVRFHPRRDGTPAGQFLSMRLPSGKIVED